MPKNNAAIPSMHTRMDPFENIMSNSDMVLQPVCSYMQAEFLEVHAEGIL